MHCKSYSHFFSKKFQHIRVSLDLNFNESLTNDVVSFEQLGPDALADLSLSLSHLFYCGFCCALANGEIVKAISVDLDHNVLKEQLDLDFHCFWWQTQTMHALTNAATAPSTAASSLFTNCATETTPKKFVQIALIKPLRHIWDTTPGSRKVLFKFEDKYGKEFWSLYIYS